MALRTGRRLALPALFILLLAGGARLLHAALLAPPALVGFTAAVLSSPYRLDRIRAFLDPYQDPQGNPYTKCCPQPLSAS